MPTPSQVPPRLSLILPVFNDARRIAANVRAVIGELDTLEHPFEVLVVCDGSSDGTAEAAQEVADARVRVLHYPVNAGKGWAVLHGFAEARGRLVGFLDADLDIAPSAIIEAVHRFDLETVDAVVGSKRHPASRVRYPATRRLYSWGFQLVVAALFRVNVRDTQVGAKVFRREMIDVVAPLLLVKRHAFDLELLAVGAEFGFDRIVESPVELNYGFSSTSINWRAVLKMVQDTLAIAYRIHLRHWYVRQFATLQRRRMDGAAAQALKHEGELAGRVPSSG
ncbi:MAG: glycosyltransferase [Actinomycetota bacterium]|nr:glycosyltransferase [Actinomycetota bacterium]